MFTFIQISKRKKQTTLESDFLLEVESYAVNYITRNVPKEYAYHDVQHTFNVVEAVQRIGNKMERSDDDLEILTIAAWFHDMGYDRGPADHEERGADYAANFLRSKNYSEDKIKTVRDCIHSTKMDYTPRTDLEKIICDADFAHIGSRNYWDRCGRVREELARTKDQIMSEKEWIEFELGFMRNHHFNTLAAQQLYNSRKGKHILKLEQRQAKLLGLPTEKHTGKKKKKNKKLSTEDIAKSGANINLKQINLGRGVETMYRTTYRTHINLSSIADNKANIMLSINAIIVSITLSTLVPRFEESPELILPTGVLLMVCLTAIILATLSTRPKITEGRFTRKDIENRTSNLLFFGNFYNMSLEDYSWGMLEMIKDEDFLYSSMTKDLYFLGIVLAKKYRYLNYCYAVFMYGIILTVIVFAAVTIF